MSGLTYKDKTGYKKVWTLLGGPGEDSIKVIHECVKPNKRDVMNGGDHGHPGKLNSNTNSEPLSNPYYVPGTFLSPFHALSPLNFMVTISESSLLFYR